MRRTAATAGLAVVLMGLGLPWSTIGGRSRSGFGTADVFLALAEDGLGSRIGWIGRWWYLPAGIVLCAWAVVMLGQRVREGALGLGLVLVAAAMWWVFVIVGSRSGLAVQFVGPTVTSFGLGLVAGGAGWLMAHRG